MGLVTRSETKFQSVALFIVNKQHSLFAVRVVCFPCQEGNQFKEES